MEPKLALLLKKNLGNTRFLPFILRSYLGGNILPLRKTMMKVISSL